MDLLRLGGIVSIIVSILCFILIILDIGNPLACAGVILLCFSTLVSFSAVNMSSEYNKREEEEISKNKLK